MYLPIRPSFPGADSLKPQFYSTSPLLALALALLQRQLPAGMTVRDAASQEQEA